MLSSLPIDVPCSSITESMTAVLIEVWDEDKIGTHDFMYVREQIGITGKERGNGQ